MAEGYINLKLKWQLTTAEKGTVLKSDSSKIIGSHCGSKALLSNDLFFCKLYLGDTYECALL